MSAIGRIVLRVCGVAWVAVASPHAASSQVLPWMEDNVNRDGGDIAGPLKAENPLACEALCGGQSGCAAWTFVRSAAPTCWLKGPEVPGVVSSNCCVSGLRPETIGPGMENNIDRWGNDIARHELLAPPPRDPATCQNLCSADVQCAAWTYVRPGEQGTSPVCYLKRPAPSPRGDVCCISGTRPTTIFDGIRISGYQIVQGPAAEISPLGIVDTSAQCPGRKVAIGAGYTITPLGSFPDVRFGLEIKHALPQGNSALVRVRNAHITQPASVRAIAVCIDPTLTLRNVDVTTGAGTEAVAECGPFEQVIGGGFQVHAAHHPDTSAPRKKPNDAGHSSWVLHTKQPISAFQAKVRAICASGQVAFAVDGWEIVANSQETTLSGRSDATLRISCPQNKALLSAGISGSGPDIALLTGSIEPGGDVSTWQALLLNRDIAGAAGSVRGRMVAICARTQ